MFVIFGLLLLAESFKLVLPAWSLIRMLFFGGVGLVFVLNFEKVTQGLLKIPLLVALCLYAGVSVLWTEDIPATISRTVALGVSMLFASYFATCFRVKDRFQVLAWTSAIFLIFSAIFIFALPAYGRQGELWRGIFAQKNGFGRAMVIVALTALTYPSNNSWRVRVIRLTGYVMAVFFVFMADSMTSIVVVVALTLLSYALRAFWLGRIPGIAFTAAALVPIVVLAYLAVTIDTDQVLIALGRNPTLTGRTDVWTRLDYAVSQKPLLGHGYGGFWHNWSGTYGDLWSFYDNFKPGSAHNTYYNVVVELGYPGLVIFVVSAAFISLNALGYLIKNQTTIGMWPFLYITFLLLTGFSEDFILFNTIGWVLYMSVAISTSVVDAPETLPQKEPRVITGLYPQLSRTTLVTSAPLKKE